MGPTSLRGWTVTLIACAAMTAPAVATASSSVDYGPISHKNLKSAGAASTGLKLNLQIGLVADNSGLHDAVKSASKPGSGSYGKYASLSHLTSTWGASKNKRQGVKNAFAKQNATAKIDVTHLRAYATVTIGKAQKLFGTKWSLYKTDGEVVALAVDKPTLPKGLKNNVDVVAGMRLTLDQQSSRAVRPPVAAPVTGHAAAFGGGTPTRTGVAGPSCLNTEDPAVVLGSDGLFPNQVLTAYGIAPLHAAGLLGQGSKLTIVGEAPTPSADVQQFRNCFGFAGTQLSIHNGSGIQPILES